MMPYLMRKFSDEAPAKKNTMPLATKAKVSLRQCYTS